MLVAPVAGTIGSSIASFIEQMSLSSAREEKFKSVTSVSAQMGFEYAVYGIIQGTGKILDVCTLRGTVVGNYPPGWSDYYLNNKLNEVDPVVRRLHLSSRFAEWDEFRVLPDITKEEMSVLNEAKEAGLKTGLSFPLHGPNGTVAIVSFATAHRKTDIRPVTTSYLHALASSFHYTAMIAFDNIVDKNLLKLTDREKECLSWVAQGKSSWDIGQILSVSENTVNFHIKNAFRKLGVNNRTAAVVKAIHDSIINI